MQEVLEILKISKVFHETVHDRVELFYLKILVEIFPRPDDAHHWMWNLIGGFPTMQEVLKIAESLRFALKSSHGLMMHFIGSGI